MEMPREERDVDGDGRMRRKAVFEDDDSIDEVESDEVSFIVVYHEFIH